jgi:cytochrome c-type biogenesis protein CcmF
MGNVAEPATKHYINRDIFTHVTYAPLEKRTKNADDWKDPEDRALRIGDTLFTSNSLVILSGIDKNVNPAEYSELKAGDIAVAANMLVLSIDGKQKAIRPIYVIRDASVFTIDAVDEVNGVQLGFFKIDPEAETFHFRLREKVDPKKEFIIMKAIIFPGINILWIGCILMFIGTMLAVVARAGLFSRKSSNAS